MPNKKYIEKFCLNFIISLIPFSLIIGSFTSNLFLIVLAIYYIFFKFYDERAQIFKEKYFFIFFIFYIYLIFNASLSENFESSMIRSLGYIKFFLFALFLKFLLENNRIDLKKILFFWFLTLLALCLDLLYQGYFGKNITGYVVQNPLRNSSFFYDELKAASLFVGFAFISFSFNINENKKIIFFLTLFLLSVLVTGERSNLIRFIFLLSILIIFYAKKINLKSLAVALLIFISLSTLYYEKISERYNRTISYSNENIEESLLSIYKNSQYGAHALTAYHIFLDNKLFGVGNKNFRLKCHEYQNFIVEKYNIRTSGCATHPHQFWYEILSEHGIFGLTLLLILFWTIFITRLKKKNLNILNIMALAYLINVFIPILPSGSFFTSYNSTIFWINVAIYITEFKHNINEQYI
jgi:O-antigen ligase